MEPPVTGSSGILYISRETNSLEIKSDTLFDTSNERASCPTDYASSHHNQTITSQSTHDGKDIELDPITKSVHSNEENENVEVTPKFSIENLIILNDIIQHLVKDLLENISSETLTIKTTADQLKHQFSIVNSDTADNHDGDPNTDFELFKRSSFFCSSEGYIPPCNEDHADRARRGEFNMFSIIKFLKKGNVMPRREEVITAVGEEMRLLMQSRLKDDLQRNKNAIHEAAEINDADLSRYSDKIKEISEKLDSICSLSSSQLASQVETQADIDKIDWTKLSLHQFKTVVSDTNLRLAWMHFVRPNINSGPWTKKEDSELSELVKELGEHAWEEVAQRLDTRRTPVICLQRWQRKMNPQYKGVIWRKQEDELLQKSVVSMMSNKDCCSHISWSSVSANISNKNAAQCFSRWKSINPGSVQGPWTEEQDIQLLLNVQRYGIQDWTRVSGALPGRRPRVCQDRYHQLMESVQPWSYKDDKRLWLLLNEITQKCRLSSKNFRELLPYFPGRSSKSLSSRWMVLKNCKTMLDSLREYIQPFMKQSASSMVSNSSRKIDHYIIYSPLIKNLVDSMKNEEIDAPEEKVFEMLHNWHSKNSPEGELDDYSEMIVDLQHGLVIPRPSLTGELSNMERNSHLNTMDHAMNLKRILSTKRLLEGGIREELHKIISSKSLNQLKRNRAFELLNDDVLFWMAYEKVCQIGDIPERLYHYRKLSAIQSMVPIFFEKMLRVKLPKSILKVEEENHSHREQELPQLMDLPPTEEETQFDNVEVKSDSEIDNEDIRYCPNVGQYKLMKLVELKRLLEERRQIYNLPKRHAKMMCSTDIQVLRHIPQSFRAYLSDPRTISSNAKRVRAILSDALGSTQDAMLLRRESKGCTNTNQNDEVNLMLPVLPLNQATILGFKTLLLERKKLTACGLEAVKQMFMVTHRGEIDVNNELKLLLNQGINLEVARKVSESQAAMKKFMSSDTFSLLRNRFLALFSWPALTSTILWPIICEKRDAYFEQLQAKYEEEVKHKIKPKPKQKKSTILATQGRTMASFKGLSMTSMLKRSKDEDHDPYESASDDCMDVDYVDIESPPSKMPRYSHEDRPARSSKMHAADAIKHLLKGDESVIDPEKQEKCIPDAVPDWTDTLSFTLDSGCVVHLPKDLILLISCGFQLESFTHHTRNDDTERSISFPSI